MIDIYEKDPVVRIYDSLITKFAGDTEKALHHACKMILNLMADREIKRKVLGDE